MELHFHAFESVFYLDTKCFERSLAGRRDATLFVYGQYCRFIRRLCHRAILPKCTPDDAEWTKLLQLCPDDLKQLSSRDFLSRLKLETDLDQACRAKIKRHQDDKKPGNQVLMPSLPKRGRILELRPEVALCPYWRLCCTTCISPPTLCTGWVVSTLTYCSPGRLARLLSVSIPCTIVSEFEVG